VAPSPSLTTEPLKHAECMTALRKAGAVVLGKANIAQWSGFRSTSGCSGWSARGGQCKGIYLKENKCSGSSSRSAAAVALESCVETLGLRYVSRSDAFH
jgi:amidase